MSYDWYILATLEYYWHQSELLIMKQQVKVIKLSGILNATTSQEFRQKITEILESDAKLVLVDCQDVTFMDSSGLGALVLAFKTLRTAGTKLVLCSINEQVRILFELTSMDKVFEIFPNQDAFNKVLLSAT
jgi:anti-anti-sigma factor